MSDPIRVQRKRTKDWRMPPNTKSVCRPGQWGNPHKVLAPGQEQAAVDLFEQGLIDRTFKDKHGTPMINRIGELRGWNLACFCHLDRPCHGNSLLRFANECSCL
jgi:Domain of unknown function (DUF4326)